MVKLAKYQYNSVLIHAEAHSRQQDPWGDQAARQLELYEDIPGHEKRIFRDKVLYGPLNTHGINASTVQ